MRDARGVRDVEPRRKYAMPPLRCHACELPPVTMLIREIERDALFYAMAICFAMVAMCRYASFR